MRFTHKSLFFTFFSSVRAGRGFVWKMTAGLALTWTNVRRTFPAVTSASTPTGLFTACVPTGTSVPPVTRTAAGLSQVLCSIQQHRCEWSPVDPHKDFTVTLAEKHPARARTRILSLVVTYIQRKATGGWRQLVRQLEMSSDWLREDTGVTYGICLQLLTV